jgi:hypothetical protein
VAVKPCGSVRKEGRGYKNLTGMWTGAASSWMGMEYRAVHVEEMDEA